MSAGYIMCTCKEVPVQSIIISIISKCSHFAEQSSTSTPDCPALHSSNWRTFALCCHAKSQCALQHAAHIDVPGLLGFGSSTQLLLRQAVCTPCCLPLSL